MVPQIESSELLLRDFLVLIESGNHATVDRKEVVAHATLSALAHHWPTQVNAGILQLLESTATIKSVERSRWVVQRRIAIAKLVRHFESSLAWPPFTT
jgi:hypothetical protein